jgi:hypothetical protein
MAQLGLIKEFGWCKEYGLDYIHVALSDSTITIMDSYKVKRLKHMREVIDWVKTYDTEVGKRSWISLVSEWRAHNLLYWLGVEKDRTVHCDLNNETSIRRVLYFLGSLVYFGQ